MIARILVLCCFVLSCNQTLKKNIIENKPDLYQHWVHSFEEDDATRHYRTYRPFTYSFAPSRGRDGFEIKENGSIISQPIAPFDGNIAIEEQWTLNADELIITGKKVTSRYKIISLTREKLVLKPVSVK